MATASGEELAYKRDWPAAQRRLTAWWDGEVLGRVCLQVTTPRDGVARRTVLPPDSVEARWTTPEYALAAAEARMEATFYGGEAFPCYWPNLGPDVFAGYLGCPLEFGPDTSWSVPTVGDWAAAPAPGLDPQNKWWRLTLEMTRLAAKRAPGRFIVGLTDLHGGVDALAALRDPQALCLDLYDCPEQVLEAMRALIPVWREIYETPQQIILNHSARNGSTTWLPVWSPGRCYPVSCDFAALVSPAMFREFIRPHLDAEAAWLDHAIFHLDGPAATRHIEAVLEIPKLRAVQWVPGAGRGSMLEWVPLLRRIQAAGKGLHLSVGADEVLPLVGALRPEGLMLSTACETEDDARALLKAVEDETHVRSEA